MRVTILAGIAGLFVAALAVVIWQSSSSESDEGPANPLDVVLDQGPLAADEAGAGQSFDRIGVDIYRGPLPADVHPSAWVDSFPTVALVAVEEMGEARWSTESGKFEGLALGSVIYTPTTLRVDEYIKGSGDKTIQVAIWGGFVDGVTMGICRYRLQSVIGPSSS